jgi:hypothetical protein
MPETNFDRLGLLPDRRLGARIAFATSTAGVLAFEWALRCFRSSFVHGLRTAVFFFGTTSTPPSDGSLLLSSQPVLS